MILIKNNDIKQFMLVIIPINWVICAVVTLLLYFLVDPTWGIGYLLGSATSFMTFGLHAKHIRMIAEQGKRPVNRALSSYFMRLGMSALVLLVAFYNQDRMNIYATFLGLLVIKISLYLFVFLKRGKFNGPKEEEEPHDV